MEATSRHPAFLMDSKLEDVPLVPEAWLYSCALALGGRQLKSFGRDLTMDRLSIDGEGMI